MQRSVVGHLVQSWAAPVLLAGRFASCLGRDRVAGPPLEFAQVPSVPPATALVTSTEVVGTDEMNAALSLAGFYAAHAVWCVSDGETLIPMIGWERGDHRELVRMKEPELSAGAAAGSRWLETNPVHAERAVLVVDGYFPVKGQKRDALIVKAVEYGRESKTIQLVVPYRHASSPDGFAVYRPKLVVESSAQGVELSAAFFRGVDRHEQGSKIWAERIDQSL
jgi:hypothetical protein